jgi:phenylpropionate dioxygenase-like ring-hydroxylating dioxygenase large terminal subunit
MHLTMHGGRAGQGPVAMLDRCPHRAAALSEGRMTAGGNLQCAYHGAACLEQPWPAGSASCPHFPSTLCGCAVHAGWTFDGESGNCVNIPQVAAGNAVSGRTCATALPCAEHQGIIWVYPSPGATPSTDTIVGEHPPVWGSTAACCSPGNRCLGLQSKHGI